MRFAAGIEYDGRSFLGWQRQRNGRTVQDEVERALGAVAAQPVTCICAGRTDSGVHASAQVVHFDSATPRSPRAWCLGGNSNLPRDVSICWAKPVPDAFHARFSALSRTYRYLICNRPTRPGLMHGQLTWHLCDLDAERMNAAAAALVGEHDFSSFRAASCQARHAMRRVLSIECRRRGEVVTLEVRANAFLHHMVRNIVGALLAVGEGERPVEWMAQLLKARDRRQGGVTAPPDGLYLVDVEYPSEFGLPTFGALHLP